MGRDYSDNRHSIYGAKRYTPLDNDLAICAIWRMDMKSWRFAEGMSMAKAASLLALSGARAYQRYETGENRPDADVVERIIQASAGAVTLDDLHQQRLAWLKANRPELIADIWEAAE